jgi:hypothetical protein
LTPISLVNLDDEQGTLTLIIASDHDRLRVLHIRAERKLNELSPALSAHLSGGSA